jgi:hypothetical protein
LEEWADPVCDAELPIPEQTQIPNALNPAQSAGIDNDHVRTVFSIAISESEFMGFNLDNDGSPGTMVSLLLSRAIARINPSATDPIRVTLCVNQRTALHAPLAHQNLAGGALLEYKEKLRSWPIDRQATAYRGMVYAQTQEEAVLAGVNTVKGITQMLLSRKTDQERMAIAGMINSMGRNAASATVSYVGKANFKEAERYIQDFRMWASTATDLLIEISTVNGRFTLDFIQLFSNPIYVNAFLFYERWQQEKSIQMEKSERILHCCCHGTVAMDTIMMLFHSYSAILSHILP